MILLKQIGLIFITTVAIYTSAISQNCTNFHKENCQLSEVDDYNEYGQSTSALMIVNTTTNARVVFFGEKDYKLTFCTKNNKYPAHFILKDSHTNEVLFDNIIDDYIESVGFTVDKTRTIKIEITIISEEKTDFENIEHRVCLGMQIYWRKMGDLGFNNQF